MTTLAEAQARLAEYMQAEQDCLGGQEIRLTSPNGIDRALVMPDLREIRRGITYWRGQVATLQAAASGLPTVGGMSFTSANFGNTTSRE